MSEELKPCPFCGYKLTMQEGVCPAEDCVDDETGQWHFTGICCPSCAVFLPKAEENSSVYDGMKAWNARHDATKDADIEKLKAALEASRDVHAGLAEYILTGRGPIAGSAKNGMFADLQRARLAADKALADCSAALKGDAQ